MHSTPVNDHPTLTHELVLEAIRLGEASTMRRYAHEADSVGAHAVAKDLRRIAALVFGNRCGPADALAVPVDTGLVHGPRTQRGYMIVGRMDREHCRAIVTPFLPANVERCMWEV
jgi:hypothetical protein